MNVLHRKLARDLFHLGGQAIAIALVTACGVASLVTMRAMYRSLLRSQQDYYTRYQFADLFAELKRAPDSVAEKIREIPGIGQVQPRAIKDVTLSIPGLQEPATARLISIDPQRAGTLNALFLRHGRYVESTASEEVIASEAFANANNLQLGSRLQAIINGRWQRLTVVGIALSPEYIYEIRGGSSLFPDSRHFGILWMGARSLKSALDLEGAFNSISASLQPHAREADVLIQIDEILAPYGGLGAYGRSDQTSHRFITDEISQNRISANVIPGVFFAVAALLVHLSFSRLVILQRSEIAVIKAFGYFNWQVGIHYVEFSLIVALTGCVLGCTVGWYFGLRLAELYADFYRFPILVYQPEVRTLLFAALVSAGTAIAGSIGAVIRAASLPPAEAMRPESPAQFRQGWIDRLHVRRIPAALRMTLRNILRRPLRALASTLAICCSIMIVVVIFGMLDALQRIMQIQFRETQREDITVALNESSSSKARLELARLPGVIQSESFRTVPVRIRHEYRWRKTALLGFKQDGEMHRMINRSGKPTSMPPDGLIICTALASALDAKPGEVLHVETLEGLRIEGDIPLVGTVDELLGTNAYMNLYSLNRFLREDRSVSGALLHVDSGKQLELYDYLKFLPRVAAVSIKEMELNSFRDTIDRSMRLSLGTLMIFAAIIASGIIYNGTRIALSERGRDLATLRVLGFRRQEITFILLGEQTIITVAALPFGLLAGYGLCGLLAARLQTELYRIPLIVEPRSYACSLLMVLFAAVISGALIARRIARLDIVSVLKARE